MSAPTWVFMEQQFCPCGGLDVPPQPVGRDMGVLSWIPFDRALVTLLGEACDVGNLVINHLVFRDSDTEAVIIVGPYVAGSSDAKLVDRLLASELVLVKNTVFTFRFALWGSLYEALLLPIVCAGSHVLR